MSYEVYFKIPNVPEEASVGGLYLGSGSDVMGLHNWVETLPAGEYPEFRLLLDGGVVADAYKTCEQVIEAVENHPPENSGTEATAEQLIEVLDRWPPGTKAIISDGANTPDDWWEPGAMD